MRFPDIAVVLHDMDVVLHVAFREHPQFLPLLQILLGLLLAPLLSGVINCTKSWFAGRRGPPVFQGYYDLFRLLRKGAVFSLTTTWVFQAGPVVGLAVTVAGLSLMPWGSFRSLFAFPGDLILLVYLLGLARFLLVLAALDTGSSFEGMGASRDVTFSALAEVALLLGLAALAHATRDLSLSGILAGVAALPWAEWAPSLLLVGAAFVIVFLTENARMPVDDPNTHLELTMVHEVMVLDHSGPHLAMIQYASALKLWLLGSLVVGVLIPCDTGVRVVDFLLFPVCLLALAVVTGMIESTMARLRLLRIPQLLVAAGTFSLLALLLMVR